ncbi:hypothetical protein PLICRDRAFT_56376 [Plicaturopsis crispa FD-325 SS-3]|nr:hypothetical protein PLICRDRAFT_56376 [Plicaturopsis crispa FD-325 SS-3]
MLRMRPSVDALRVSLRPCYVSSPRPLGIRATPPRSPSPTSTQYSTTELCDIDCEKYVPSADNGRSQRRPRRPIKRRFTLAWKRLTEAMRPSERMSFIPRGFTLVT